MRIFPPENCCIVSSSTCETLNRQLERLIDKPDFNHFIRLFSGLPDPSFFGEIQNGHFKIIPLSIWPGSSTPQIDGTIEPFLTGSKILLNISVKPITTNVMARWWLLGIGIPALNLLKNPNPGQIEVIFPIALVLLLTINIIVRFKIDKRKIKKQLLAITSGEYK
jgi:hypothetical protein